MGLEMVELVMEVEYELSIKIPDDAQLLRTVGEFHDLVVRLVNESETSPLRQRADLDGHLWNRIAELSAEHGYGHSGSEVTRLTRYVEDLGYG